MRYACTNLPVDSRRVEVYDQVELEVVVVRLLLVDHNFTRVNYIVPFRLGMPADDVVDAVDIAGHELAGALFISLDQVVAVLGVLGEEVHGVADVPEAPRVVFFASGHSQTVAVELVAFTEIDNGRDVSLAQQRGVSGVCWTVANPLV